MIEKWENLKQLIEYSAGGILSKELIKNTAENITLFCMAKGTEISEHTSTKEGFVYIVEGDGAFNLEGNEIPMKQGTFIVLKKDAIHSLKASENTSFILSLVNI